MICEFQSLYFGDDGYVVRCKQCAHFQIAFISTILTLTEEEFGILRHKVAQSFLEGDYTPSIVSKCVILTTPSEGVHLLLTRQETKRLFDMLEEADNEYKALSIMRLFH